MTQGANILVGSLDRECVGVAGWQEDDPLLAQRQDESLRLGILFSSDQALVPAPAYFEADAGRKVFTAHVASQERGRLALHGFGGQPEEYVATKLDSPRGNHELRVQYQRAPKRAASLDRAAWLPKAELTDARLVENWNYALAAGSHPLLAVWSRAGYSPVAVGQIAAIPERLEGAAMLATTVFDHLPKKLQNYWTYQDTHALRVYLAVGFFESYLRESRALPLVDTGVGIHDNVFPSWAPRLTDRRLRALLDAFGVKNALLRQIPCELLVRLVETQLWGCLRPELISRAFERQPFSHRELKALRKARETKKRSRADTVSSLEGLLTRQLDALERVAGSQRAPSPIALFRRLGMSVATGSQPALWRGDLLRGGPPSSERAAGILLQVLQSSTVGEVRESIENADRILSQHGFQPDVVVELVISHEELRRMARGLSDSVKTSLINLDTETSSSIVGRGLAMALEYLNV